MFNAEIHSFLQKYIKKVKAVLKIYNYLKGLLFSYMISFIELQEIVSVYMEVCGGCIVES